MPLAGVSAGEAWRVGRYMYQKPHPIREAGRVAKVT